MANFITVILTDLHEQATLYMTPFGRVWVSLNESQDPLDILAAARG